MADQDLTKVFLTQDSLNLIERLNKLSPAIGKEVKTIAQNAVRGTTELALKGYLSKVPVDTFELRGYNLDDGYIKQKLKKNEYIGLVYIKEAQHTSRGPRKGRKTKEPISSTKLARILNLGTSEKTGATLHRTKDSAAIDSFGSEKRRSPTADWEGKAERAVRQKLGSYLKSTDFTKGF
jgi:hypothetical protein